MKQNTVKTLYSCNSASTLVRVLKPVRILTRVVFCLPEWIDTRDPEQPMSIGEVIALCISWLLAAVDASLLTYGVYSFVILTKHDGNLLDIVNPMLWVLWNTMPFFIHVFILCNLSRLRKFFQFLKTFRDRQVLLHRYHIEYDRTPVIVCYVIHLAFQVTSGVALLVFMREYPTTPPLLTSITAFQDYPLCYVAYLAQSYNGIYVLTGLVTTDLGIGFLFYCLSLSFRSLTLFAENCSSEIRTIGPRPVSPHMAELWETYENILKSIEKANKLLGPLVLANQLNHLTGAVVFTFSGMRSVFALTPTSVPVYILNWAMFYFRAIIFNYFVSQVNKEHNRLQNSLAWLSAAYNKLDLQGDKERSQEYSTVKALLNRVQNNVVAVNPLGLYRVTSGTLCAMAGTITAYLVVLLQTKASG